MKRSTLAVKCPPVHFFNFHPCFQEQNAVLTSPFSCKFKAQRGRRSAWTVSSSTDTNGLPMTSRVKRGPGLGSPRSQGPRLPAPPSLACNPVSMVTRGCRRECGKGEGQRTEPGAEPALCALPRPSRSPPGISCSPLAGQMRQVADPGRKEGRDVACPLQANQPH